MVTSKQIATASVIAMILLSGCMSLSVDSKIANDGTIDRYEMTMDTSVTVYSLLNESAKEEGHSSFEQSVRADIESSDVDNFEYTEEFDRDQVTITILLEGYDPSDDPDITTNVTEDTITFQDNTWVEETDAASVDSSTATSENDMYENVTLDYRAEMPGEIIDSNADSVDGTVATWEKTGSAAFSNNPISVTSERSTSVFAPGFGVVVTLLSFVLIVTVLNYRTKQH